MQKTSIRRRAGERPLVHQAHGLNDCSPVIGTTVADKSAAGLGGGPAACAPGRGAEEAIPGAFIPRSVVRFWPLARVPPPCSDEAARFSHQRGPGPRM